MMLARDGAITGLAYFKMEVGIVSGPVLSLVWRQLISFIQSSVETGCSSNFLLTLPEGNTSKVVEQLVDDTALK